MVIISITGSLTSHFTPPNTEKPPNNKVVMANLEHWDTPDPQYFDTRSKTFSKLGRRGSILRLQLLHTTSHYVQKLLGMPLSWRNN